MTSSSSETRKGESIIDCRGRGYKVEYLMKWSGDSRPEWVPLRVAARFPGLLKEFRRLLTHKHIQNYALKKADGSVDPPRENPAKKSEKSSEKIGQSALAFAEPEAPRSLRDSFGVYSHHRLNGKMFFRTQSIGSRQNQIELFSLEALRVARPRLLLDYFKETLIGPNQSSPSFSH